MNNERKNKKKDNKFAKESTFTILDFPNNITILAFPNKYTHYVWISTAPSTLSLNLNSSILSTGRDASVSGENSGVLLSAS